MVVGDCLANYDFLKKSMDPMDGLKWLVTIANDVI